MANHKNPGAVLITGASSGIGRQTALDLDHLGWRVFASVRSDQDVESLQAQASERLKAILLDVTDGESIARAKDEIQQALAGEGLSGLVNNAGISFIGPLEFMPVEDVRRIFDVNVFGLLAVTQAFLPLLRQAQGRIVNISSITSQLVTPFQGPYSATKMSVNAFSDSLRLELRHLGVPVSVIVCGSVQTPIWEKGVRLTGEVTKAYPRSAIKLYGAAFRQVGHFFNAMGRSGVSPQVASAIIIKALTAKHPRNAYLVGADARRFVAANRLLPGRLRDWVVMRMTGLNRI